MKIPIISAIACMLIVCILAVLFTSFLNSRDLKIKTYLVECNGYMYSYSYYTEMDKECACKYARPVIEN